MTLASTRLRNIFMARETARGAEFRNNREASAEERAGAIVRTAFARIDIRALAITSGVFVALVIIAVCAVILLSPPAPGRQVGEHLALLANYFPGFSVSWIGCGVGAAYGFAVGVVVGAFFGTSWNTMHVIYLMVAMVRRPSGTEL
jgi:hypothetical protein